MDCPDGSRFPYHGGRRLAQLERREWRTRERAANVKPVSTKIAFYSPKVDATPAVKPRGRGK